MYVNKYKKKYLTICRKGQPNLWKCQNVIFIRGNVLQPPYMYIKTINSNK